MAFASLDTLDENEPLAEINMVPLIDVMLVLLIIFMVAAPLMTHAVKVELPKASSAPATVKPESVALSIDGAGRLYWNGQAVDAALLAQRLQAAATLRPQPELHIHANRSTPYEKVAQVMSEAARQGLTRIGFVTANGPFRLVPGGSVAVAELAGNPVRGLAEEHWGRVAATRNGIWLEQNGRWQRIRKGEAWTAAALPDGTILVGTRDQGVLSSRDGQRWQVAPGMTAALAALPGSGEALTLARLALELHTGRSLLGRDNEWVWIDVLSLSLGLLGLTGLSMWWRTRRGKRAHSDNVIADKVRSYEKTVRKSGPCPR